MLTRPNSSNRDIWIITGLLALAGVITTVVVIRNRNARAGFSGYTTDEAFQKWINSSNPAWLRNGVWGKITHDKLHSLHPQFRSKIMSFFERIENQTGYTPIITSGLRDSVKQAELYRQNPSNAKPGYSLHEYGFAVDINLLDSKTGKVVIDKNSSKSKWDNSGVLKIAKGMGLLWGGTFAGYYDPVHFYVEPK